MRRFEHRYLGWDRFPEPLASIEIEQFFGLTGAELACVQARRTPLHRMAVALHIGFLKMTGRPLNSVEIVPQTVLAHLGRRLDCTPPRIASIRALYRRRRTLFEHQAVAAEMLGLGRLGPYAERGLIAYLRREAMTVFDADELVGRARSWLADHRYVLPNERRLRGLAVAACRHQETGVLETITAAVEASIRENWLDRLTTRHEPSGMTVLEWLRAGPAGKSARNLEDQVAKVRCLDELGARRLVLTELPLAGLEHFAAATASRKPASLSRLAEPRRTLEIACFLRLQLVRLTDTGLDLIDHRIADLWRGARDRAEASEAAQLRRCRRLVAELARLAEDEQLDATELKRQLRSLIAVVTPERMPTRMAATRQELARSGKDLGLLLAMARAMDLQVPADHPLAIAFATLDQCAGSSLPVGVTQPFGTTWKGLIEQEDRAIALGCYRAATLMALKRGLRNGSIAADHSVDHRRHEDRLIPRALWERDRGRLMRDLGLPRRCETFLRRLEASLAAGLAALAEAVEADSLTRFSWTLFGRPPHSELELITLYGAILALGADLSAAQVARMVPRLDADSVGVMMARIQAESRLRAANDDIVAFMRDHSVVELWGGGLFASADMTSLDATRHLWAARLDPRRRTFAVGSYTHVLDQWGIVYDQPILLNRRQAGAAIEGALRQRHVLELERVAVDTHGHTHFAMTLAKLTGFDLCPRLARLKTRKLYLPRGLDVPENLRPIVAQTVSRRAIVRGWDGLARLASSVREGWCPATEALERFGAATRGDLVHAAGNALGKLLRTVYLCDYLGSPAFRDEILALLNQGEAVHSLQRAIQQGPIGARRGRTPEQLAAVSGALTLLANLVMAWNTWKMQALRDHAPERYSDELMARIAPTAHRHINMRGTLAFDLARHRSRLLPDARPLWAARKKAAKA
jgi:TnpA family transposase